MSIPPFDPRGLIPPFVGDATTSPNRSPYIVSISDLVVRFSGTQHRKELLRKLISYRQLLASDGYEDGLQFIDGSFVEDVETLQGRPPTDIDVFSVLNAPTKYLNDSSAWSGSGFSFWRSEVVDRNKNKQRFSLDTYALLLQETSLPDLIRMIIYWYGLFSHQRDTFVWKGFAAVPLDRDSDRAALDALGPA